MIIKDAITPATNNPKSSVIPNETAAQKPMSDHTTGIGKR
jgi:hypothetical protein